MSHFDRTKMAIASESLIWEWNNAFAVVREKNKIFIRSLCWQKLEKEARRHPWMKLKNRKQMGDTWISRKSCWLDVEEWNAWSSSRVDKYWASGITNDEKRFPSTPEKKDLLLNRMIPHDLWVLPPNVFADIANVAIFFCLPFFFRLSWKVKPFIKQKMHACLRDFVKEELFLTSCSLKSLSVLCQRYICLITKEEKHKFLSLGGT